MAYDWQYFDAYRLNVEIMNTFLVDTFGQKDYGVYLSNDYLGFWYERNLNEVGSPFFDFLHE
ncbi:hypothetical protein HYFRA_00009626 [Hymenoscyphus fraxineus]|uniref:Uncharacterized protein n=1 Tax=Hymenoscyphus fraxineus TaxID=746836 RepID=A0A9N9PSH3_9HELO|nr:hypothetical protein HYFRA_00009626 [Hymenoscyphus fraxineus]